MTPTPNLTLAPPSDIVALWRQYTEQRRSLALSRRQRAELRARLGELLADQQNACRARGVEGEFAAWLQTTPISPATAYRLIAAHRHPHKPIAFIKSLARTCLSENPPPPPPTPPDWELRGHTLTVRLSAREAELARRCLAAHSAFATPSAVDTLLESMVCLLPSRQRQH